MNDIQAVFARLNDIESTIKKIELNSPSETSFLDQLTIDSLRLRRDEYKAIIEELSQQRLVDVCDYRIVPDLEGKYAVKAVAGVLGTFQDMFTAFFGAIRENRPKQKATFDQDIIIGSTLNMGYAYSGSLGFVLYVENDRLLPSETDQDKAIDAIFQLVKQKSASEIKIFADKFGRAPVKRFYDWSKIHSNYNLAIEIKWKRGAEIKSQVFIQPEELAALNGFIEKATEITESVERVEGILVALDVTRQTFKLSFSDADVRDMKGVFDDDFNWKKPHVVPGNYRGIVKKKTTFPLWSEVETIVWTLVELEEVS